MVFPSLQEDDGVVRYLGHVQFHWSLYHVTQYGLHTEDIIKQKIIKVPENVKIVISFIAIIMCKYTCVRRSMTVM